MDESNSTMVEPRERSSEAVGEVRQNRGGLVPVGPDSQETTAHAAMTYNGSAARATANGPHPARFSIPQEHPPFPASPFQREWTGFKASAVSHLFGALEFTVAYTREAYQLSYVIAFTF